MKNFFVWIAISGSEMSEQCFQKSEYSIGQFVYRDECLEPYSLSFFEKYHKEHKFVFGSDLANAHYAFLVQDWLNSKKITFVLKSN